MFWGIRDSKRSPNYEHPRAADIARAQAQAQAAAEMAPVRWIASGQMNRRRPVTLRSLRRF